MSYDDWELASYLALEKSSSGSLIPLHPWNKLIAGKKRGGTPMHSGWNKKQYPVGSPEKWIRSGCNLGWRVGDTELVIDIDPRNFGDVPSQDLIVELLGAWDIDEVESSMPCVRTGGGGLHIYCSLPAGIVAAGLRATLKDIPGVDFKRLGGYVVAAGSRHVNGNAYRWVNECPLPTLPAALVDKLKRPPPPDRDYKSGFGAFTGTQLEEIFLNKLDVADFSSNDCWEPLMMECHHATAGLGVEEFLRWSLEDSAYAGDESSIRTRWDSLHSVAGGSRTAASLIWRLKTAGEDTTDARATMDFSSTAPDDAPEKDSIEQRAKKAAEEIDLEALVGDGKEKAAGETGSAIEAAKNCSPDASAEEKMKVCRLINAASAGESIEAQEILIRRRVMSSGAIGKRIKSLRGKVVDTITEILSNTVIKSVFNDGAHLLCEPNGQIWMFAETHWRCISDNYLGKIIFQVLDVLKSRISIDEGEVVLVSAAIRGIKMRSSVRDSRIWRTEEFLPIINCENGELWINPDGRHELRNHSWQSYQTRCLAVSYDPSAVCPLFNRTVDEIFSRYKDGQDIVRHVMEVMGYIIQPHKPIAAWWMFRGGGGDGKSTLIKVLNAILGDSLYSADENLLESGSIGGNSHVNADLVNKLAVVIEELKVGKTLNDSGLKMLSENTKMTANPKFLQPFSFSYIGTLIMCSNFYPPIRDTSEGTMRRANVIPFNRQFVKHGDDDVNRGSLIVNDAGEIAGILNLMLEGYQRMRSRGHFQQPASCIAARDEWLRDGNPVARFIDERLVVDSESSVKALEVYQCYVSWCAESGIKYQGRNNFYNDLANLGFALSERRSRSVVGGCSLISEF